MQNGGFAQAISTTPLGMGRSFGTHMKTNISLAAELDLFHNP